MLITSSLLIVFHEACLVCLVWSCWHSYI